MMGKAGSRTIPVTSGAPLATSGARLIAERLVAIKGTGADPKEAAVPSSVPKAVLERGGKHPSGGLPSGATGWGRMSSAGL